MTSLKPLIKWSGGKQDEIKHFADYLPNGKYFPLRDYNLYLEPFAGGAAVYFHLHPARAVLSDVHTELVELYREVARGNSAQIHNFMETYPNTEETYYYIRNDMPTETSLDVACRFYYLRKTCFRGMLRYNKQGKFNIPFGRYKTIQYKEMKNPAYETTLRGAEILCESFENIFARFNSPDNFMFLDPPYDSVFTDYGYCQFGETEHRRLAELFKTTQIKCLMIIGKTPLIEELYNSYIAGEYEKKYKFKIHSGRVGDEINTTHLIIKNW